MRSPCKTFKRVPVRSTDITIDIPGLENVVHQHYKVGTVKLHAATCGIGTGKPLMVFIHGFPEAWFSWRHQIKYFMDDYEIIALDCRGYGTSDKPKRVQDYALDKLCKDIDGVVTASGHKSCILVGHDWGGAIAWTVAHNYPQIVEKLVVLCAPHPTAYFDPARFDSEQTRKLWYMLLFQCPYLPEVFIRQHNFQQLERMFKAAPLGVQNYEAITDDDLERYKAALSQKGALTAAINFYRASCKNQTKWPLPEMDKAGWLPKSNPTVIEAPVLLMYGEFDGIFTHKMFLKSDEYTRDLTKVILPSTSHWAQQDSPQLVNSHMHAFLQTKKSYKATPLPDTVTTWQHIHATSFQKRT